MPTPDCITLHITDAGAMEQLGRRLAACCTPGCRIFLQGQLGAGKTTLARGFLQALGHQGRVKSPTYTLVEPYRLAKLTVNHIDLYRLDGAGDLETLGWRDYLDGDAVCLVEWPERGEGSLGQADLFIEIHILAEGRSLAIHGATVAGRAMLDAVRDY